MCVSGAPLAARRRREGWGTCGLDGELRGTNFPLGGGQGSLAGGCFSASKLNQGKIWPGQQVVKKPGLKITWDRLWDIKPHETGIVLSKPPTHSQYFLQQKSARCWNANQRFSEMVKKRDATRFCCSKYPNLQIEPEPSVENGGNPPNIDQ